MKDRGVHVVYDDEGVPRYVGCLLVYLSLRIGHVRSSRWHNLKLNTYIAEGRDFEIKLEPMLTATDAALQRRGAKFGEQIIGPAIRREPD